MLIMKKIFLTAATVLAITAAQAQFTYDYLRAADQYYRKADYNSAAQYYEKYLASRKYVNKPSSYNPYAAKSLSEKAKKASSSEQEAVYKLADSYRQLHYYDKAAPYFETSLEYDKTQFPLAAYYYATALRALGKYEAAETAFNNFLQYYATEDKYRETASREIKNLQFIRQQLERKDLALYRVQRASGSLNSTGASYAPAWLNDNTLLFTSTRPDASAGKNEVHTNRVYAAAYTNGDAAPAVKFPLPQPDGMHQGAVSLTPDGNTVYLTRWKIEHGNKISAIYISKKSGDKWSEPRALPAVVNTAGYNTQQPFVMPDGKTLLFASDKPGGFGGFDIWYANLDESGLPLNSTNLGEVINTPYNEQTPYYHGPSTSLVFSTDGRVGMGGYDLFYSKGAIEHWNTPVNFGNPVNSVKDDMYFTSNGQNKNILHDVLLGSDRAAACCLELFALHKNIPPKQLIGLVVGCDDQTPLAGAAVQVIDTVTQQVVFTKTTGSDGLYSFTVDAFKPLKAVAEATGYITGSQQISVPADEDAASQDAPVLCLVKVPVPVSPVVLENVYYDFNKASLKPESFPSLDKLVALLQEKPGMRIEISAHTDSKGNDKLNARLSEARAKSCVDYLISKGIDASRLESKGYGAGMPVAPNTQPDGSDDPEGRQKNRRTEFKVLN